MEGGMQADDESVKLIQRKEINYKHMEHMDEAGRDGLRGIGAFAVYIFHSRFW